MNKVAAIIVTHNSGRVIGACLASLEGVADAIVIDNASSDDTVQRVRECAHASLVVNGVNRGFAAGVNQGARVPAGEFLLILNPDATIMTPLERLIQACATHGIAAGKLTGADGNTQRGFTVRRLPTAAALSFEALGLNRLIPANPVNRRYRYLDRDLDREGPVEQPAGAFLMVRRDVFERLGGFDESFYPVWFEDVDFAARARANGYRPYYVPEVAACHSGAHSVGRLAPECRKLVWYVSLLRYAGKHFGHGRFRTVCLAVAAGCGLRLVAGTFQERSIRVVYRKVIRLALRSAASARLCFEMTDEDQWRKPEGQLNVGVASNPARR